MEVTAACNKRWSPPPRLLYSKKSYALVRIYCACRMGNPLACCRTVPSCVQRLKISITDPVDELSARAFYSEER